MWARRHSELASGLAAGPRLVTFSLSANWPSMPTAVTELGRELRLKLPIAGGACTGALPITEGTDSASCADAPRDIHLRRGAAAKQKFYNLLTTGAPT